jgi:hypothetical protein
MLPKNSSARPRFYVKIEGCMSFLIRAHPTATCRSDCSKPARGTCLGPSGSGPFYSRRWKGAANAIRPDSQLFGAKSKTVMRAAPAQVSLPEFMAAMAGARLAHETGRIFHT